MCEIVSTITAALGLGGGATAAGATAAAATTASTGLGLTLQQLGTLVSVGGTLYQGVSANRAAKAQAAELGRQKAEERALNAVKDQRTRQQFAAATRKQAAELAGRGVSLDSPTAVLLGQEAAREMSFESQSIRATGEATQRELSGAQRIARARGTSSLLRGITGASSIVLDAAPDLWPELMS